MCPDPQVLSIYMDGELPSPWKEKLEAHLQACPACKEKLNNYKHVQEIFRRGASRPVEQARTVVERHDEQQKSQQAEIELLESSKERVWQRLASRHRYNSDGFVRKSGNIRSYSLWRRKINLPLPAVAVAALVLIIGAAFLFQNRSVNETPAGMESFMFAAEDEIPIIPANMEYMTDINSILQYLGSDGTDIIIFQLPQESRNFSRYGEPAMIRSADYSQTRRHP